MSVDLRPPLLDEVGLVPALRAYLHAQATLSGVAMDLKDDGGRGAAPRRRAAVARSGDRVLPRRAGVDHQRAAACGGRAKSRVRIARRPHSVRLAIQDDGRGFDTAATLEAAAAGGHLGIVGMRERARAGGGTFKLESQPGKGTTVEIELPIAG